MTKMNNLFATFDPTRLLGLPINWIAALSLQLILPMSFWARSGSLKTVIKAAKIGLHSEFSAILGPLSRPGLSLIPISLCLFIMLNNFLGLAPHVFTSSRHPAFTVAMAFPLWAGHIILGMLKTPTRILAHLVPLGTPVALMPFIVLIELVRRVIRPLTLRVRLAANMVAGHLLLTLLGNGAPAASIGLMAVILITMILLITLEIAVALIQSYVFSILRTLYFNEVNSPPLRA